MFKDSSPALILLSPLNPYAGEEGVEGGTVGGSAAGVSVGSWDAIPKAV